MDLSKLFETWGPLIGALLPIVFTLIPGVRNMFAALPRSFFEAVVATKGGKIVWEPQANPDLLKLELQGLVSKGATDPSNPFHEEYMQKREQFSRIGDGTIIEWVKKNPMIIAAIVGGIFLLTNKGGCQKVNPTPVPPAPQPVQTTTDLLLK